VPRHSKIYRNFAQEYDRLLAERLAYPEDRHIVNMDPVELDGFLARLEGAA